jgi:hypothetical protein
MPKIGYIIIALVAIFLVGTAGAFYALAPKPPEISIGVKAGDTFTYNVKGLAEQYAENETIPAQFYDLNKTDYVRVTIINVANPNVTYSTTWRYINGTQYDTTETLNLMVGNDSAAFWGIYASNLAQGNLLRALRADGGAFNSTESRTYADGSRETNAQTINKEFYNAEDTTQTLYRNRYLYVDKATGMLVELKNIDIYTSPRIMQTVQWTLVDSNVIQVSS